MMKFTSLVGFFFVFLSSLKGVAGGFETSMRISELNENNSGCDLYTAKFDNKKSFIEFFQALKKAGEANKVEFFASLVLYPLHTKIDGRRIDLKNSEELNRQYTKIFTPNVLRNIELQQLSNIYCTKEGVRIGSGELWIQPELAANGFITKIGIRTVNP